VLIAFVNSKGGVGKSTLAVHLSVRVSEKGRSVALVDLDKDQQASSNWIEGMEMPIKVLRLFTPKDILASVDGLIRQHQLVVADGPAALSDLSRAILLKTDLAVIPCGPSALDLRAARAAARTVSEARQARASKVPLALFAPNRLQAGTRLSRELVEAAESLSIPSCDGLRLRQAYADAAGLGTVVWRLTGPWIAEAADEMKTLLTQIEKTYEKIQART
jgi:chromosome partitioning protein